MLTITTDWQNVSNGDTTQLDLSQYNYLDSARIRWKGDRKKVYSTAIASGDAPDYPAVPFGYNHYKQKYYATIEVTNLYDIPSTLEIEWTFNYKPENYVAETEYVDIGANETIYLSKSYETYSNWVGVQCGVSVFTDDTIAAHTNKNIDAKTIGYKYIDTQNPSVIINDSTTTYSGTLYSYESAWQNLSGLLAEQINNIAHSIDGSGQAEYQIEYTVAYPVAPERISPENQAEQTEQQITFELRLTEDTDDPSSYYHAKIRYDDLLSFTNPKIIESKENQTGWEYYDTDTSTWEDYPVEGVAPDTIVRYTTSTLDYAIYYWKAQTWSTYGEYGEETSAWKISIQLSTSGLYTIDIEGTSYSAYTISVTETCNGEIGQINLEVNNENNTAYNGINYDDEVLLVVNDKKGNQEQFKGRVKRKNPSANTLEITAVTGGGILSERIIDKDYSSQNIGLTAKDIVDNYCSPLTSNNIDTSTSISAPIKANGKKPLKIFEDMRRQHGISYYVDKDWDVHFYTDSAMSNGYVKLRRGD